MAIVATFTPTTTKPILIARLSNLGSTKVEAMGSAQWTTKMKANPDDVIIHIIIIII